MYGVNYNINYVYLVRRVQRKSYSQMVKIGRLFENRTSV